MLPDWIGAHVNALAAIGGVPKALVPDNLKAGITKPSRYEPGINRTYQDLADHYGCVVLPTRVMKPRDKAKVEVAVQIVERFVLAKLRNRRFFSLAELNAAIRDCVAAINAKVMRRIGKSRHELLETLDRPALNALPTTPYCYAEWKRARVAPDYHIEIAGHYYSVPSRLIREIVEARITSATVEIFHKGQRVASHARLRRSQPAHHDHRAHAERASPLRRMDAGQDDARGGQGRPGDGRAVRSDHEGKAASRAGLPLVPRHRRARQKLWPNPPRSRIAARQRHRRDQLRLDRLDPQARARQSFTQPNRRRTLPPIRHGNIRGSGYYH